MDKYQWLNSVIEHSEMNGVQLTQLDSEHNRGKWCERMARAIDLEPETLALWSEAKNGIVIEWWRTPDRLGGLLLLDVTWCQSTMLLHLQVYGLFVSPGSKRYMINNLKSLGDGFEVIFNQLALDSLTPVVIIDVADHIPGALLWRDALAEEFEAAQSEGDLILVTRGGDLVQAPPWAA